MTKLHKKYVPVVHTGPRHLSYLGTAQIWADIYGERVGYNKCLPKDKMLYDLIEDCFGWTDSLVSAPNEKGEYESFVNYRKTILTCLPQ